MRTGALKKSKVVFLKMEDTININDLVMSSDTEKMVTLMLLIIWIQMCIE